MRFAIVGCGQIATTHARALRTLDSAELVVCHDTDITKGDEFAGRFGCTHVQNLQDLLAMPDIDAVTVCTPSGSHALVGVPALLAGKHVLVEKPMDVTQSACQSLLDAAAETGACLSVVAQRRFDESTTYVRDSIARGRLGSLTYAECRVPWYRTEGYYDSAAWRGTWAQDGGGALMNQGLHAIDLMRWLCGPVVEVRAISRNTIHDRIEVEDLVCALVTFANGAVGNVMASTSSYPAFPARIAIQGTEGGAVIEGDSLVAYDLTDGTHRRSQTPAAHTWQVASGGTKAATPPDDNEPYREDLWTAGHVRQLDNFVAAASGEAPQLVTGVDAMATVILIEAIYRSAKIGQPVVID